MAMPQRDNMIEAIKRRAAEKKATEEKKKAEAWVLKNTGGEPTPCTTQTTTQRTAQKILAIVKATPSVSRAALSREIGLSSDGIKWHLQKLKECNAIRRVGPKYGGHWEVIGAVRG